MKRTLDVTQEIAWQKSTTRRLVVALLLMLSAVAVIEIGLVAIGFVVLVLPLLVGVMYFVSSWVLDAVQVAWTKNQLSKQS